MKHFRNQINHVCNYNFASITICINWKLNVDVDFGAKHFCGTIGANLAMPIFWHFWPYLSYLELASLGLQKCYAPKFTSTISLQLIQMVVGAKLLVEICLI